MFSNLPFPSLFVCFLIFIVCLNYKKRKATKKENEMSEQFWQREEEANRTRNKDISHLPLFHPEQNDIPLLETDDENTVYYQKKVLDALTLPMMDLSEYTNTDLKLAYGVGNFKTLSNYDENFNHFLNNLSNLGNAYFKTGHYQEAESVFRLCLRTGSRKQLDYKMLGGVYAAMKKPEKVSALIREVEESNLSRKDSLIQALEEMHRTAAL